MQSRIVVNSQEESLLSTHKVLRNTYFLLGLTMAFSAVVAYISMSLNLPYPNLIMLLVGFYGLLFVTNRLANSAWESWLHSRSLGLWVIPSGQF